MTLSVAPTKRWSSDCRWAHALNRLPTMTRSRSSMLSPQRTFTATQSAAKRHRAPPSGGSHSSGPRLPLERLADALTATRLRGLAKSLA